MDLLEWKRNPHYSKQVCRSSFCVSHCSLPSWLPWSALLRAPTATPIVASMLHSSVVLTRSVAIITCATATAPMPIRLAPLPSSATRSLAVRLATELRCTALWVRSAATDALDATSVAPLGPPATCLALGAIEKESSLIQKIRRSLFSLNRLRGSWCTSEHLGEPEEAALSRWDVLSN